MKALLALILALALPPLASAQLLSPNNPPSVGASNGPLDRIVAVVNDGVILQSELDQALDGIRHQYAAHPGQLPPPDVLQRQVLERLILTKLQVQRADDNGVRVSDDDLDHAIATVAQQNKMTVPDLRAALQGEGIDYGVFRANLRDQILVQRLQQKVMQDAAQVSDAEIDNLIASPEFKQGEVHLADIMVALPEGADAKTIAAAQAKAGKVETDLKGSTDFAAEAIKSSDAPEALEGGDLGWHSVDELPPAFTAALAGMKPGDVSQPIRGPSGFHIIKLIDRRDPNTRTVVTEYHARHIMITPNELLSAQDAQQKIGAIYQAIVSGQKDFAAEAKADSSDPTTANVGGDMGWFTHDDWGAAIGAQIDKLKPGQVSQPFQTSDGSWHIVQLLDERQSDKTKVAQRERARQAIAARKGQQAYQDFLRQLRSEAFVEIRLGNDRTASTGNPGKP